MYVDAEYYLTQYGGKPNYTERELEDYLLLAEIKVDEVTFGRIRATGIDALTEFQREKVLQAVCRQADYIAAHGYDSAEIQSYSVLDISVTSKDAGAAERTHMCPVAFALLRQAGLMCRGA